MKTKEKLQGLKTVPIIFTRIQYLFKTIFYSNIHLSKHCEDGSFLNVTIKNLEKKNRGM